MKEHNKLQGLLLVRLDSLKLWMLQKVILIINQNWMVHFVEEVLHLDSGEIMVVLLVLLQVFIRMARLALLRVHLTLEAREQLQQCMLQKFLDSS